MHIRDAIINGGYAPGEQLTEATLAQELGTSRGTVREAMGILTKLGLVSRSAHRGPTVTTLTPQRAREIYTLRALLESFAARIAAERGSIDADAIAVLERLEDDLADAGRSGGVGAMVEADMNFHRALSALAGHELLNEHLAEIQTHNRRLLVYSDLYRPDFGAVVQRHGTLLDVVRTGDPDRIARAVHDHIIEVGHDIVAQMLASVAAGAGGDLVGGQRADGPDLAQS